MGVTFVLVIIMLAYYVQSDSTHDSSSRGLDTSMMYNGIMQSENIAIHVIQNLINFLASTVVWGFIMPGVLVLSDP